MIEDEVDELLAAHSEEVRRLTLEVIGALRAAMPEASVAVARGWRSVNFRHPVAGYVCGVFTYSDRVDIAFEAGYRLSDPKGILEPGATSGKRVRYVRCRPGDPVDAAALEAFVEETVALSG